MPTVNEEQFSFRLLYKRELGLLFVAMPDVLEYLKTIKENLKSDEMAPTREVLNDIITNLATTKIVS